MDEPYKYQKAMDEVKQENNSQRIQELHPLNIAFWACTLHRYETQIVPSWWSCAFMQWYTSNNRTQPTHHEQKYDLSNASILCKEYSWFKFYTVYILVVSPYFKIDICFGSLTAPFIHITIYLYAFINRKVFRIGISLGSTNLFHFIF
jgi:hypothetical protein